METLRILHIDNYSDVANQIAAGQRALGHEAHVIQTWHDPDDHEVNFENYYDGNFLVNSYRKFKTFRLAKDYDVVHVHGGIYPYRVDNILIGLMGRPFVVHYHGSETRLGGGMWLKDYLPWAKVVATPDLLRWHPDAEFIPNPYSSPMQEQDWEDAEDLRILHAPTKRRIKGTDKVLGSVEMLRARSVRLDFRLLENVTNRQLLEEMSRSHIIVDWISDERETGISGIFGMTSLEAMNLGRMAVAYLSPETIKAYPEGLPVVSPSAPSAVALADLLEGYLSDHDAVRSAGKTGRSYVRRHLNPEEIAKRHIELYHKIQQ